jgi:hypothetical protein
LTEVPRRPEKAKAEFNSKSKTGREHTSLFEMQKERENKDSV